MGSRLNWFGHVERKDSGDWVEQCMALEIVGTRPRSPKKPVKDDMKSFGLSHEDALEKNDWRVRIKGAPG